MTTEESKALIRRVIEEIFNQHQVDKADLYYAADYIQHATTPGTRQGGREGFKNHFRAVFDAFPDWHVTLGPMISEGDLIVSFQTHTGTHKKEWRGIPATNKHIQLDTADLFRIINGRIAEHWHVACPAGLKWEEHILR